MYINTILLVLYLILNSNHIRIWSQVINRPPHFIHGTGDMSKFVLKENTPVGTPVYQLKGSDPEGSLLHYSISGQYLTVDRNTGVVTLQQPIDREQIDSIEVIISVTDQGISGTEANTVSLRREIAILDVNDNAPMFQNRPYSCEISESTQIGHKLVTENQIIVTDKDEGINSEINIECSQDNLQDDICNTFHIETEKIDEGVYKAHIILAKALDYEQQSTYVLTLKAKDYGKPALSSFASVAIEIIDVQDQPPVFLNAPFSATVQENTPPGTSILKIKSKDGDFGNPRPILLTIEDDELGYFDLITEKDQDYAILVTSDNQIDRENSFVLQNGGIYSFSIRATELINNELPADSAVTQVTIVITDEDDQIPQFNKNQYEVNVPEDISNNTPLPQLNIYIVDNDIGINSRYNLSLENINFSDEIFEIMPKYGEGRTAVVIKVVDSSKLDYDVEDERKRKLQFEIIASVNNEPLAIALVSVHLQDANDNPPMFDSNFYKLHVLENSKPGYMIADIRAQDIDGGNFGKIHYNLKGFGAEKFKTYENDGGIYVEQNLDYETQKSYTLSLEAIDGGGLISTVNVFIDIDDVNDNAPFFDNREYLRTVREGATSFEPQLFVHASDRDGPDQGGGKIYYSIEETNSISEKINNSKVFSIDSSTGEIKIERPVRSADTNRGQYDLIIKATDAGIPPLSNDTRVLIRVGIAGNQRPIFKGNYNPSYIQLFSGSNLAHYKASINETAAPGTNVTQVQATDPDGLDIFISYFISSGHKDNFIIDKKSGLITTSPYSNLDLDSNPKKYELVVHAVDNGLPIHETATATVFVSVLDVNNKPPKFSMSNQVAYVKEQSKSGDWILRVLATDRDNNSKIEYTIVEPISAKDKTGVAVKDLEKYKYKEVFRVDKTTGDIFINNSLNYELAANFILTVRATDINAEINKNDQFDETEVSIFVQSNSDQSTIMFTISNTSYNTARRSMIDTKFDQKSNLIKIRLEEEQPIGFKVIMLEAYDPILQERINHFELINSGTDLFTVLKNGEIILTKRLDFDSLDENILSLVVKAISSDHSRSQTIQILIEVLNINDNYPVFDKDIYHINVRESSRYPEIVLTLKAIDLDANLKDAKGYGDVRYSINGENVPYFIVNSTSGVIQLSPNLTLDRERQSVLRFNVTATDTPSGGPEALKSTCLVIVDVLDVNDNAPKFNQKIYTAVIAENAAIDTSIVNVTATDPDEGIGGQIFYEITDSLEVKNLLKMNVNTGEIKSKQLLTGKGRQEPYLLNVRAQDGGGLSTDVMLTLYIGDVSSNDGVPTIIKPTSQQKAFVSENASIGSMVFQVVATDADDPRTPAGQLQYKILNDGADYEAFRINSDTGLITTRVPLDREKKQFYTLVVVVQDLGEPPQQATRVLQVEVTDIDDHKPQFIRNVNSAPIFFSVYEEVKNGTYIGEVKAEDLDIGDNAAIDYAIIYGNDNDWFRIDRTEDNRGLIRTSNRIDRERNSYFLLTIKCFKYGDDNFKLHQNYNNLDPSEIQVRIDIIDIDDNVPNFLNGNQTIGVRLNVPIDTAIITLEAIDLDSDHLPMQYSILNSTFVPLIDFGDKLNETNVFGIDAESGEVRTVKSLIKYVDGLFILTIRANNSFIRNHHINTTLQIYIIRDRDLLRFVFNKSPSEIRKQLKDFEKVVEDMIQKNESDNHKLELHVYDAQFYTKSDNSLDFSSTSSCFQIIDKENGALTPAQMEKLLKQNENTLKEIYNQYQMVQTESCSMRNLNKVSTSLQQLWMLIIAAIIGIVTFLASCILCCLHRKYKKSTKLFYNTQRLNFGSTSSFHSNKYTIEPIYNT